MVAGEEPAGLHYALAVCRATEKRLVPESKGGVQIVKSVHVVVAGDISRRIRNLSSKGELPSIEGYNVSRENLLHIHYAEDILDKDAKKIKTDENFAWIKNCHPIVIMTCPWEAEAWISWTKQNAHAGSVAMCILAGMRHIAEAEQAFKDSGKVLLFGAPTYAVSFREGDGAVCAASLGALLLARIPRAYNHLSVQLQAFEASGLRLWYRDEKYKSNWLIGALMWRLYDVYAALRFDPSQPLSFYQQLASDKGLHRRVLLTLMEEAQQIFSQDEHNLIDFCGSPFGLSLRNTKRLLQMPDPLFMPLARLATCLTFTGFIKNVEGVHYGDDKAIRAASFVNGAVIDQYRKVVREDATKSDPSSSKRTLVLNAFLIEQAAQFQKKMEGNISKSKIAKLSDKDIEPLLQTHLYPLPLAMFIISFVTFSFLILLPAFVVICINIVLPNEAKFL